MAYEIGKWLHILSSTVLFGTGIGSAYYMFCTCLRGDPALVAHVARLVVIADWIFTATTIVLQPLTGLWLVHLAGIPLTSAWLVWTYVLYVVAGACWIPVVVIQIRMRRLAEQAAAQEAALPPPFWRLFRWWTALGVPAFVALVVVFWLMVAKPM